MIASICDPSGVAVLPLQGALCCHNGAEALSEAVQALLNDRRRNIVLNLGQVKPIDSTGIGHLVMARSLVINQGGQLKLCCLTPKARELLEITRLIKLFEVYDTEEEAIASFDTTVPAEKKEEQ